MERGSGDDQQRPLLRAEEENVPLFPLIDRQYYRVPVGFTTISVLSSQGKDPTAEGDTHTSLRKLLVSMPYVMFLVGFAGLAASMVATRRSTRLLGCASGFLLAQLVLLVIVGGVVTIVRSDIDPCFVWPVTGTIVAVVIIIWTFMCSYPKWLRCCCATRELDNPSATQQKCTNCGAATVDGRSPTEAPEGAQKCPLCGAQVGQVAAPVPTEV
ncbi:hypothetical protein ACP70R_011622 [Stipagrostis hirtigluma subsp. patula]